MLTLKIKTKNAAFENDKHAECARILRDLADKLESGNNFCIALDYNGNLVGNLNITNR